MNGVYCSSRPMRVSVATDRSGRAARAMMPVYPVQPPVPVVSAIPAAPVPVMEDDASNTTVFVGGLDPTIGEDELKARFSSLGEVHIYLHYYGPFA